MLEKNSPANRIKDKRYFTMQMEESLKKCMNSILDGKKYRLGLAAGRLNGVSPLQKLGQGYSYTLNDKQENVKSISRINEGDLITVYVSDGKAEATVVSKEKLEYNI